MLLSFLSIGEYFIQKFVRQIDHFLGKNEYLPCAFDKEENLSPDKKIVNNMQQLPYLEDVSKSTKKHLPKFASFITKKRMSA